MLLLLTNDDGVNADGLWALIKEARKAEGVEIVAVAPDRERSASAHAISIHHPIEVCRVPFKDERIRVYSAGGTPADCVKLAVEGILPKRPDFLISGINRGPNLGTDVFYSGTVSAALEGTLLGVKSMAVSLTGFENLQYEAAAEFAVSKALLAAGDPQWPPLVNVNVPAIPKDDLAGTAVTELGIRIYRDVFQKRVDPKGRTWYWLGGTAQHRDDPRGCDAWAIQHNLISVTPLSVNLTDAASIDLLTRKFRSPPFLNT